MLQMRTGRVFSEAVPIAATPERVRRIRAPGGENDSPSRELTRSMADTARIYFPASSATTFTALMVSRPDRYLRGGDHSSFNHQGFAAVRLTERREDYNHQHQNVVRPAPGSKDAVLGDLLEFVDFNYVAKVARLNAAVLATLAASPGQPPKVAIDTEKLETARPCTGNPLAEPCRITKFYGARRRRRTGNMRRKSLRRRRTARSL
jgi:hypothetical protein